MKATSPKALFVALCLGGLALYPFVAGSYGLDLVTKIMVYAIFALSLELLVGATGLVCFGHAAFFGIGAYAAVLLSPESDAGQLLWLLPACVGAAAAYALFMGALSLRTQGVYFIMVTLAFAQMAYYLFVSARSWGGDDGLPLSGRMTLAGFSLADDAALFHTALALLALAMLLFGRLAQARFGRTLQAIRENETRMEALGYPVFRYRLVAFALGGAVAGLAGALLANLTGLASPNLLQWTQSGTLLVMVIIGGVGYLYGGVLGAAVLLLLEETLVGFTEHWHIVLGLLLLAVVLFAPKGVAALFGKRRG